MKKINDGIFLKDSGIKGKIVIIMVGVHGNELSGIKVLNEINDSLNIKYGKVYFIYGNLQAIEENVRYTQKNLNRCFLEGKTGNTYEDKRAEQIKEVLKKSDYLLDLHNTISKVSSLEILITKNIDYAKYFDVSKVVSNIDKIQSGGSDGYMDNIGKKGFCLECGSINYGDKNKNLELAKSSIMNFLKVTGNIDGNPIIYNNEKLIIDMKYMYFSKTKEFVLRKEFKDFEFIKKGEIIGKDGEEIIKSKFDCYILFAYNTEKIGDECFCIGEEVK